MDKPTMIKLMIRYLIENNHEDVANELQKESGIELRDSLYNSLISSINQNDYSNTLTLLTQSLKDKQIQHHNNISMLTIIYTSVFYWYIYNNYSQLSSQTLLENIREHMAIITSVQSNKLDPEYQSQVSTVQKISSSILFSKDPNLLIESFPHLQSSSSLIEFINQQYNNTIQGNDKRLENVLRSVYKHQIDHCTNHNCSNSLNNISYSHDHACNHNKAIPNQIAFSIDTKEEVHNIVYSNNGQFFAAVLANKKIKIYSLSYQKDKKSIEITEMKAYNPHNEKITSISWNRNDTLLLTSSKDKMIKLSSPFNGLITSEFKSHTAMVISATFIQNDSKIASCGHDYIVCITNLQGVIEHKFSFPGITVNEVHYSQLYNSLIIVAATGNIIRVYDLEVMKEKYSMPINDVVVSCSMSKRDKGKYLLINTSKATPVLLMTDIKDGTVQRKYFGHRQERFTIKCNFGGCEENFIVCGSEDANAYVWHRSSSIPILSIKVHSSSVNSVIWPFHLMTGVILTCSDDHTINVLKNDEVDKIYYNEGKELENKMMSLDGNIVVFPS